MLPLDRRQMIFGLAFAASGLSACERQAGAEIAELSKWSEVIAAAKGQTVNWSAWAGDPKINDYIAWTAQAVSTRFGVRLVHAKAGDTSGVIQRLLAEKTSGRQSGGRTDLIWINGENFIAAKDLGLLWGPFAERLPNWRFVDTKGKPSTLVDFTIPTEGYESPWGMAQLTFFYDAARLAEPPRSIPAFLDFAAKSPGRFTYPAPPDFTGVTLLKQALIELTADRSVFGGAVDDVAFAAITEPLWRWLDALHPLMWRGGRAFPPDYPSLRQLLEDQEIDLAFAFNPAEASNAVSSGLLPETTRAYILDGGTIQNTHFLAIPFNSPSKAASMLVADFLLSPEAQARKADPRLWGDPSVLALDAIDANSRSLFETLSSSPQMPGLDALSRQLPEPHPSWHLKLGDRWRARYAA